MTKAANAYDERLQKRRCELIGGAEKMLARPAICHANVAGNIFAIFYAYLKGKKCKIFGEVDVFFDEQNRLVPDLVVVCDKDKIKYNGIHGAPDLIIEILSPATAKNDRGQKKGIYEKFGVKEYWLVNPKDRSVEIYHLADGRFKLDNVYHDYSEEEWNLLNAEEQAVQKFAVKVSLYDDLEISVKEIFDGIE